MAQPAGELERADQAESNRRTPMQALANFITVFGLLLIFNAACMFILGMMTEIGMTNESTARWSEINVTAEEADAFGLRLLVDGVSAAAFEARHTQALMDIYGPVIERFIGMDLLEWAAPDRLRLTGRGTLVANSVCQEFLL